MAWGPLQNYPDSNGSHRETVVAHRGPASYTQMTAGPVAGGDTLQAVEGGLKHIDFVAGGLSDSGTYRVECVPAAANPSTNKQAASSATTYVLRWVVVGTGSQAASELDLSAETVRLRVIGRY